MWLRLHVSGLLRGGHRRQLVATVVIRVRGVTLGPQPLGFVALSKIVQLAPEVLVTDGLLIAGYPAFALPTEDPLGDAVLDVNGVGDDLDFTWLFDCSEPLDGRHELHAVVGGVRFGAVHFLLVLTESEDARPAAGAGVPLASAIRD